MIAKAIYTLTLFASLFHHVDHVAHEHVLEVLFNDANRRSIVKEA